MPHGDIRELADKARTLTVVELREAVDVRLTGRFPDSVEWVVKGKRWVDAKFGRD